MRDLWKGSAREIQAVDTNTAFAAVAPLLTEDAVVLISVELLGFKEALVRILHLQIQMDESDDR